MTKAKTTPCVTSTIDSKVYYRRTYIHTVIASMDLHVELDPQKHLITHG